MDIKKLSEVTAFHFRVWSGNKEKTKFSVLWYIDARDAMDLLDKVCWVWMWQRDHKEIWWNLYAWVWIYIDSQWVWKRDCGIESSTEKQKWEASDSFKRACVNRGIWRRLYTLPSMWITSAEKESNKYNMTTFVRNKFSKELTIRFNLLQPKAPKAND